MELKHGDLRVHKDVGPCTILALEGRVGVLVAVRNPTDGKFSAVYAVDSLCEDGWSRPRKRWKWTQDKIDIAVDLRKSGKSQGEIAIEMECSRSEIGRILRSVMGIDTGHVQRCAPALEGDDIEEIGRLHSEGYGATLIADWIGCSAHTVRKFIRKAEIRVYNESKHEEG